MCMHKTKKETKSKYLRLKLLYSSTGAQTLFEDLSVCMFLVLVLVFVNVTIGKMIISFSHWLKSSAS